VRHRIAPGRFLPAVLMLLALASIAEAQDCTGNGNYRVRIRPGLITFPSPTVSDYQAGWLLAPSAEIRVQPRRNADRGWELCLAADGPTMGVYGKPVSDIEFQQDGTGTWIPLTTTDQLLAVGDRNRTVTLQFRLALDWTLDVPGQYETDFTAKAARD
jgi:hypothetical protein